MCKILNAVLLKFVLFVKKELNFATLVFICRLYHELNQ